MSPIVSQLVEAITTFTLTPAAIAGALVIVVFAVLALLAVRGALGR